MSSFSTFKKGLRKNTKMIFLETPTNPILKIVDIQKICEYAKEQGIVSIVDNTFCSPILQSPLLLGADIVIHSVTKYIGGHSDIVGGVVITKDDDLNEKIRFNMNSLGVCCNPFDSYLLIRSLNRLPISITAILKH